MAKSKQQVTYYTRYQSNAEFNYFSRNWIEKKTNEIFVIIRMISVYFNYHFLVNGSNFNRPKYILYNI